MSHAIFINQIIAPVKFANELIEFLFAKYDEIEISFYGKMDSADRKILKGVIKNSLLGKLIFKRYDLRLDHGEFEKVKNRIEKYFENDWGLMIDENHKGLFSLKKGIFSIDCIGDNDKMGKEDFLNSLIQTGVIDKFEIIEDDYVDPYLENK